MSALPGITRRKRSPLLLAATLFTIPALSFSTTSLHAQAEPLDAAAVAKISDEAFNRSQAMTLLSWLTDVHGPRLTGSPITRRAADWTMDQLRGWGLSNVHLETWGPFGRGWTNDKYYVQVTSPVPFAVIGYPQAWTPGTNGLVSTEVVYLKASNQAELDAYKGKLAGKVVMVQPMRDVPARFVPQARRFSDEELAKLEAAPMPAPAGQFGGARPPQAAPANAADSARMRQMEAMRAVQAFNAQRTAFLNQEGVTAILEPGRGDDGTVFTPNGASRDPGNPATTLVITTAIEHYGRIFRALEKGQQVKIEMDVKNTFYDNDLNSFNIVAEIPGSDPQLKDEVVMLGGHFDSWHAATGATDNAAGSVAMMEAVRILQATGLKPKRTVRIVLWTGEEQGLYGSRAYVREHFGVPDTLKAAASKVSVYFNLDNGTGAIRGVWMQGNDKVAPIFRSWMKPFEDKGVKTLTLSNTGGTDHLSFDAVGIPGFQFIQDDVEYGSRTHHSNMDTYERIQENDMKLNAAVIASFVYQAANRPQLFPRKDMPRR